MLRTTPYTYLYIAGYAMAAAVFCLLILFLASSRLDPLIQGMSLFFYLAAALSMGLILRHQSQWHEKPLITKIESDVRGTTRETVGPTPQSQAETRTSPSPLTSRNEKNQQQASIILLSRNEQTARMMRQHLAVWRRDLQIVNSCAEAIQLILNRTLLDGDEAPEVTLFVDTQGLEMDPIHLPTLIRHEGELAPLRLISILTSRQTDRIKALRDAGYNNCLSTPIDKPELFSLISPVEEHATSTSKVVNLAHFRQRNGHRSRKHILLADQHSADRKQIAALLKTAGHWVKQVENGEQALDALEYQRFDVAVINLHLPIMNGTQVIKLHRFTTPHPDWLSFIVMTDQTTPATLRLCRDLQIKACFFKPVPTNTLLELIDSVPAISHSIPTAKEPLRNISGQGQETQFLHADLLNMKVLEALEQLDNNSGFVPDLIAIFERDSIAIMRGMEEAAECRDKKRFIDLSNILLDNAGQLGAFALYEMCLTLQQNSQQDLNATMASKLSHLRDVIVRTNMAFRHYLKEQDVQHSDQS
jgi:two-component system sensor histidine kinase RpfC